MPKSPAHSTPAAIPADTGFNPDCGACPRLADFLSQVRTDYPDYHARPVAPFGATDPRLLIVGLAPGLHGANATGRPFTGDFAGTLLYNTLFEFGFSNQPISTSRHDSLQLIDCRITNAVKCLPPQNKPLGSEIATCNSYLRYELGQLKAGSIVLALGGVAHSAVLAALGLRKRAYPFGHGLSHRLSEERWLIDSYHCSRYNTQTRRLNADMFRAVFAQARRLMNHDPG